MSNHKRRAVQFLRFCTVGLGNTGVDFIAFYLLTLGGVPFLLAHFLSYSAGVVNSFFFNRKWTFRVTRKTNVPEVVKFIIVNGLSLLVSSGLLFILHDVNHLRLWFAKITATGGGIIVNFLGSRLWVFTENQKQGVKFHENQKSCDSGGRTGHPIPSRHKSATERNVTDCG